jgi:hypothetical protein
LKWPNTMLNLTDIKNSSEIVDVVLLS